ncbi:MAG: dCMP deaminase family protein [Candidatus Eremiobacteraeota bacterium]|nr:dCMP deaminase family protein [Candidatus Eremiobacteraeota bacterium]
MEWKQYFMSLARQASLRSKCMSRHFGAVIVKNKCVVSMGYNGPARGASHCSERIYGLPKNVSRERRSECPRRLGGFRTGEGIEYCVAGHAERNTIAQAAMNGISTLGADLYTYSPLPCKECAISIINAGIARVFYLDMGDYDSLARILFKEADITIEAIPDIFEKEVPDA